MEQNYLTIKEAAAYLGIAVSTPHVWKSNRMITATTVGRVVRFRKFDLDRFMASRAKVAS